MHIIIHVYMSCIFILTQKLFTCTRLPDICVYTHTYASKVHKVHVMYIPYDAVFQHRYHVIRAGSLSLSLSAR
jgi:hypothetical protein